MHKNLSIDELKPGMFVSQVTEQTGKIRVRSGGLVKTEAVISQLRERGIRRVDVDLSRSKLPDVSNASETVAALEKPEKSDVTPQAIVQADALYQKAVSLQRSLVKSLKDGAANDLKGADSLSQSIIESVFDNQDAISCLTMIKDADEYTLEHAINCSILMAIFAAKRGFDRDTIDNICMGTLLMDIGMSLLPAELRQQSGPLSEDDKAVIESHVEQGLAVVEQYADISDLALTIVAQHHERVDGSGYPERLQGEQISEFARMAAIVDTYDAMISNRPHQASVTPAVALKRLTKSPGLDQDLVKQFVALIGIHPVGSLVQLASGKLGIVVKTNASDMLKPVVMVFYSVNGGHYSEVKRIDLSSSNDEITGGVRPDDFNINLPKFFRDVFVHQMPA
ncbi:HD-GYP domain-containing protein [Salinimonas iocasae]|uniref:DUF3391 domain-containing protein n=1 Tax=Salinimonas iocasae TaxID=2572577 RepID=A0A5B7YGB2_9ALTE|nr:HD-GYP domain-containing protein [Salinimonas iocasae]QCZ94390.1 DUF3391 domain-containing protein [Salinimonas iocasae]